MNIRYCAAQLQQPYVTFPGPCCLFCQVSIWQLQLVGPRRELPATFTECWIRCCCIPTHSLTRAQHSRLLPGLDGVLICASVLRCIHAVAALTSQHLACSSGVDLLEHRFCNSSSACSKTERRVAPINLSIAAVALTVAVGRCLDWCINSDKRCVCKSSAIPRNRVSQSVSNRSCLCGFKSRDFERVI